ncbi:MAG: hypothetical protein AAF481_04570 [Acidobacteriota bacterium]
MTARAVRDLRAAEQSLKLLRFAQPRAVSRPESRPEPRPVPQRTWWTRPRASAREVERAEDLLCDLLALTDGGRELRIRNEDRFHSLALAEVLLEEARETGFDDPREGERLARLGLLLLESLDSHYHGRRILDDLRGRAHVFLGNNLRLARDLQGAERELTLAAEFLADSPNELEEVARVHFLALLRKEQGRCEETADLLHEVCERYESLGEDNRAARAFASLGDLLLRQGLPEEAAQPLAEALVRLDPEEDPRTLLCVRHNLVVCLLDLGKAADAEDLFQRCEEDYERFPDTYTKLHADWLRGMLAAGLGREEEAEAYLTSVRDRFVENDLFWDSAIISLDLAMLYSRQGRTAEVREIARTMTPIIAAQDNPRETTAALMFFATVAEQERASVQAIRRVAQFLRKASLNPQLKFSSRTAEDPLRG